MLILPSYSQCLSMLRNTRYKILLLLMMGISLWSVMTYYVGNVIGIKVSMTNIKLDNQHRNHIHQYSELDQKDDAVIHEMNLQRVGHVSKMCDYLSTHGYSPSRHKLQKDFTYDHLLVDDKHKFLYCYVPKVACTNWKRILMVLTGRSNSSNPLSIPANAPHRPQALVHLSNLTLEERNYRISNYRKFIFVRHPFERILSAYRNKLEKGSSYFQDRFGRYIIKQYRANPTNISLSKGNDVTFLEFVAYLVDQNPFVYNEHWQTATDLCRVCDIHYDFIGKFETLAQDSRYVLKQLGVETLVEFPSPPLHKNTRSQMTSYYRTIPLHLLTKLFNIYSLDFKFFNYTILDIL